MESLCIVQRSLYTSLDRSCSKMAQKRMLVKLGDSNRPVSFVSDGENDQDIVREEIRRVYHDEIPENSSFILQMKDEEWGGEFVDISPSQTNIASRSILKVIVKKVSFNAVNHLYLLLVKFMSAYIVRYRVKVRKSFLLPAIISHAAVIPCIK